MPKRHWVLVLATALLATPAFSADDDWPRWRGPADDGMARGDAPIKWSDTENVAWKLAIPGKGHSSPVIWGDKLFLTTAIPTSTTAPAAPAGGGRGGMTPAGAVGIDHKFVVMCINRNSGKVIWEQTAKVAAPHEGYHSRYGSYASNSPVTDGKYVYAFFGSRGIFVYDLDGKLIWQKDFAP